MPELNVKLIADGAFSLKKVFYDLSILYFIIRNDKFSGKTCDVNT